VLENIDGFKFTVPPTVFNPTEYISSEIFARFIKQLPSLEGKYVLDMGCGSGVVSVFAASKGARSFAVDINPMAAKAAEQNARINGLIDKVEVYENDLFANFPPGNDGNPRKFDIIFFNPPYYKGTPLNNFERAFKGGEHYEVISSFIKEASAYLKPKGEIYFIISSDMPLGELEKMFRDSGFDFAILQKIEKFFETFYITKSFLIR
jgi:release factor glutamine methyltransferase